MATWWLPDHRGELPSPTSGGVGSARACASIRSFPNTPESPLDIGGVDAVIPAVTMRFARVVSVSATTGKRLWKVYTGPDLGVNTSYDVLPQGGTSP